MSGFARKLIAWQRAHGRHGLPWQGTRDPYRIWLAEIMLQQTQVAAVIPYYRRFLREFPTVQALARAKLDRILRLWSGLGYYARARNLHRAAHLVVRRFNGTFPENARCLEQLPGIGRSTAAAIAVFAFGRREAILDGNARRVLARRFGVEEPARLWALAEKLLPRRGIEAYTQGLMDLGATVCLRRAPRCEDCPVARACVARREGRADDLPARKKKRPLAQRTATWLVLLHERQVLLERRPPRGVWGGLWCFPELHGKGVRSFCSIVLGCEISSWTRLPAIEHGFTHFLLRVAPVLCRVSARARSQGGRQWIDLAQAAGAAVPSPVKRQLGLLGAG